MKGIWNIQIEFTYFTHSFLKGEIDTWKQFLSFTIYNMHISYNDPKKFHTQCRLTNMLVMQQLTSKELLVLLWDSSLGPGFLSFPLKKPKLSIPLFCRYFHFRSQYLFELNLQGNNAASPVDKGWPLLLSKVAACPCLHAVLRDTLCPVLGHACLHCCSCTAQKSYDLAEILSTCLIHAWLPRSPMVWLIPFPHALCYSSVRSMFLLRSRFQLGHGGTYPQPKPGEGSVRSITTHSVLHSETPSK